MFQTAIRKVFFNIWEANNYRIEFLIHTLLRNICVLFISYYKWNKTINFSFIILAVYLMHVKAVITADIDTRR